MLIADLHIHSRFSRATSREGDAPHLDFWARRKGIGLVGTGDVTHPQWRAELHEALQEDGSGLYRLRPELRIADAVDLPAPRFVLSCEISCIYKQDDRTRKVHNVFLLPSLAAADRFAARLERIGNIHSDGRPILGLSSRDLLEIALEADPQTVCIPAHIWTPHFSLFGAFSGFDRLEDCFGDLSGEIHAPETGLSSDPPMNWRISALDRYILVSNSDAHSPAKLGREANLLAPVTDFAALRRTLCTGEGFGGTLEFFPEEGKYHLDGHRSCEICLSPEETMALGGKCPVCGRKLTVGVNHRVCDLADRPSGFRPESARPFERLIPLPEVIGAALGTSAESKRASEAYEGLLRTLGNEFSILRSVPIADISLAAGELIAEGVQRVRAGEVIWKPGYDGEFGHCTIFTEVERRELSGQTSLFGALKPRPASVRKRGGTPVAQAVEKPVESAPAPVKNAAQAEAIAARDSAIAVIAGPGSGKTHTLVGRIESLLREGVRPEEITAVTFTNQAAAEMRERLEARLGGKAAIEGMTIGTFHAICLRLLREGAPKELLSREQSEQLLGQVLAHLGLDIPLRQAAEALSRARSAQTDEYPELAQAYASALSTNNQRDLDGLLLEALAAPVEHPAMFRHLLVDEFQDVNAVQRQLVRHWSAQNEGLFVIGDPDQSIYGFRGASASCFDDLRADHPNLRTIRLRKNYRSTPQICQAALDVIRRNPGDERILEPVLPSGAPVRLLHAESPFAEAVGIAKEITRMSGGLDMLEAARMESMQTQLRAFSEMAVLCRTHRQLELIEDCLRHDDIPVLVIGRQNWLEDEKVLSALRFLRENSPSGREKPRRTLERWAVAHGSNDAVDRLLETAALHDSVHSLLDVLLLGEEADVRRANGKTHSSGAVRLMTLHGAKGLEFPVVFLAGLTQGTFPPRTGDSQQDLAEERRLLFVGMTRAKEELVLSCARPESPFVPEILHNAVSERVRSRAPQAQQLSFF